MIPFLKVPANSHNFTKSLEVPMHWEAITYRLAGSLNVYGRSNSNIKSNCYPKIEMILSSFFLLSRTLVTCRVFFTIVLFVHRTNIPSVIEQPSDELRNRLQIPLTWC